jgi:hypothetical protein
LSVNAKTERTGAVSAVHFILLHFKNNFAHGKSLMPPCLVGKGDY